MKKPAKKSAATRRPARRSLSPAPLAARVEIHPARVAFYVPASSPSPTSFLGNGTLGSHASIVVAEAIGKLREAFEVEVLNFDENGQRLIESEVSK